MKSLLNIKKIKDPSGELEVVEASLVDIENESEDEDTKIKA
ncbi:MAG: hypothetical protein ACRD8W_30505 [Nitrososphaeraceae archaeon]